jgi:sugar O-acyltransferase (sialic acid O-acetyltransferase NeuD family)
MKEKLILIGAGGHAKSCIDVIELENKFIISGLIDIKEKIGDRVLNYPIIDHDENLLKYIENHFFLITIGQIKSSEIRFNLFKKLTKLNAKFATIISPLAYISKHSKIEEGSIVMHHAIINANSFIGKNCIINSKALIEHDCIIGNHCHISTASILNGNVKIDDCSFIGSNSVIVNNLSLPKNSFIKANQLVKND